MFADFRRSTQGTGTSFKGALDYYLNDKGQEGERLTTDERVDVLELRNLATNMARHAWFEMMNTADASAALKEAAGIGKGGRKGEKPVFAYYLSWHESERPDRTAMLDAAQSTLKALDLEGHQAVIVSHTDTDSPHVHIVVNRVNPQDGRYAGLSNSWKTLKQWAVAYEQERGQSWHLALEQAKQARQQRQGKGEGQDQTDRQAAYNAAAADQAQTAPAKPPRPPTRPEWQARKGSANDNQAREAESAAKIRATLDAAWQRVRQREQRDHTQREADRQRFWQDRKVERDAIYQKYQEANAAVWKPQTKAAAASMGLVSDQMMKRLEQAQTGFERRERSLLGRLANARKLATNGSVVTLARLVMNEGERRRQFEVTQHRTALGSRAGGQVVQQVKADWVPETRRMKADRLKVMRTAELTAFDKATQQQRDTMKIQHGEQAESLKAIKASLSAKGREAWAEHGRTHRQAVPATGKGTATRSQAGIAHSKATQSQTIEAQPIQPQQGERPTQDRFGRSRDRKPRAPRQGRQEREEKGSGTPDRPERQETPQQAATRSGSFNQTANPVKWTAAELKAYAQAQARETARGTERGADNRGKGRER